VLQERQFTRVGGRTPIPVDVRFISATNADIELEESGFRADLLDRLRLGGSLWLPPLRERKSDIPGLVKAFVQEAERRRSCTMRREITAEALALLGAYEWPGNIRELQTCILDAVNRHPDVEHLVPGHLRLESMKTPGARASTAKPRGLPETKVPGVTNNLGHLIETIGQCDFPARDIGKWAGQLAELQREHAHLLARYLQAALAATKRHTPAAPHGQIQIHPAVKLISGDSTLTASKAADVVKRILGPLRDELQGDLADAYRTALRLRPTGGRTLQST
jgi:transcriptional regulator with GAF, ATPase, and Fis domain